jgi:hypothetical protein
MEKGVKREMGNCRLPVLSGKTPGLPGWVLTIENS